MSELQKQSLPIDAEAGEADFATLRVEKFGDHGRASSRSSLAVDVEARATDHPSNKNFNRDIVTWDGPDDPAKPTNWPSFYRWTLITLVSSVVFVCGLSSSFFAPGVPALMEEFHSTNSVLATWVVTIFVLGLATGPLVFAPLSELYGRTTVQHVGNIGFLLWTIACALATNLNMLIGFRLMQGIFAAVPLTNGGGVIADIVKQEERGFAMSMFTMGLLAGPVVGPVCGGFLAVAMGWRWTFWLSAVILAAPSVLCLIVWRESYPPVLLARKATRLREETGNMNLRSEYDKGLSPSAHFTNGIVRAGKLLLFSPIVASVSLYMGLCYSYFYLLITTLTPTFEKVYHFSPNIVGLAYLGLGIGYLGGQFVLAKLSDRILQRKTAKLSKDGKAEMKPEYRLPLACWGSCAPPVAFLWYGWSAQARVHWIMPIIGPAFLGFGNSLIFMSTNVYLVDAFGIYAASALAATTVARSVMAAVLPLAAPKMYAALGLGWGNSLLAFLALACIPIPWLLMKHGEAMRKRNENMTKNL